MKLRHLRPPYDRRSSSVVTRAAAAFGTLPHAELPLSACVDFLHMLACGKPAVRFKLVENGHADLARWCVAEGYACQVDDEGFCCVAPTLLAAHRVLEVDRLSEPHEFELGLLLGYPVCCCDSVAEVGESAIDDHAAVVAGWHYNGHYRLIDPSRYRRGESLICHLPCSPTCGSSLKLAVGAARFLKTRLSHAPFNRWQRWAALL